MPIRRTTLARYLMDRHLYSFGGGGLTINVPLYRKFVEDWLSEQGLVLISAFRKQQGDIFVVQGFERNLNDFVEKLLASTTTKGFGAWVASIDNLVSEYREEGETMQIRINQSYLDGSYNTSEYATALQPRQDGELVHNHSNKHFKGFVGTHDDAQYSKSKGYVAALEAKAVRVGLPINGVIYFKHNEIVGSTGAKCGNVMSQCIRVDSPTSGDQHSHPIPLQHQLPYPAHNNDIADLIVECVREDPGYLPRIAKYLADVHETIHFNKQHKKLMKGFNLPACPYWVVT